MIVFDDIYVDIINNKKLNTIANKLIFRERKLNISLVSVTQSYFAESKIIRPNSTRYSI